MKYSLLLPQPHSEKQRLVMNALQIPGLRELWVACGTKWGKSLSASTGFSSILPIRQRALYRWIAPIYLQTKIGYKYINSMIPESLIKTNESAMTIRMIHNNAEIQFLHGKNPESTIEGEAVHAQVLDECSKMKESVYNSAKTTQTVTQGPMLGISTPLGKNWFYKRCMYAKEHMIWAKKRGVEPKFLFLTAPTIDNPNVTQEVIDEARSILPVRLFEQYYEARFIDDGSVFTGVRDIIYTDELDINPAFQQWYIDDHVTRRVVVGADWAKKRDFTVFTAWDIFSKKMVGYMRLQGLTYPRQIDMLIEFTNKFHTFETVYHDMTGVGVALDDMLAERNIPFHGVVFSNASKNEMVLNLMTGIESQEIEIPYITEMVSELDSYSVEMTSLGLPRYNAPDGMHDDIVSSMLLGYSAWREYTQSSFEVSVIEEARKSVIIPDEIATETQKLNQLFDWDEDDDN